MNDRTDREEQPDHTAPDPASGNEAEQTDDELEGVAGGALFNTAGGAVFNTANAGLFNTAGGGLFDGATVVVQPRADKLIR